MARRQKALISAPPRWGAFLKALPDLPGVLPLETGCWAFSPGLLFDVLTGQTGAKKKHAKGLPFDALTPEQAKGLLDRLFLEGYAEAESATMARTTHRFDGWLRKAERQPPKRRRVKPRPLTVKQAEAFQVVGECKGNVAEAARKLKVDRKTLDQHYRAGMKKLGKGAMPKPKTTRLPADRRGQANVAADQDRRNL